MKGRANARPRGRHFVPHDAARIGRVSGRADDQGQGPTLVKYQLSNSSLTTRVETGEDLTNLSTLYKLGFQLASATTE